MSLPSEDRGFDFRALIVRIINEPGFSTGSQGLEMAARRFLAQVPGRAQREAVIHVTMVAIEATAVKERARQAEEEAARRAAQATARPWPDLPDFPPPRPVFVPEPAMEDPELDPELAAEPDDVPEGAPEGAPVLRFTSTSPGYDQPEPEPTAPEPPAPAPPAPDLSVISGLTGTPPGPDRPRPADSQPSWRAAAFRTYPELSKSIRVASGEMRVIGRCRPADLLYDAYCHDAAAERFSQSAERQRAMASRRRRQAQALADWGGDSAIAEKLPADILAAEFGEDA